MPQTHMGLLGLTELPQTVGEHYEHLRAVLDSPQTLILLDTSILGYFYRLSSAARRELLDWCANLGGSGRLKVPAWAASEYFARSSRHRLNDYRPNFKELERVNRLLDEQLSLAQLSVDEAWTSTLQPAQSRDEFLKTLADAVGAVKSTLAPLRRHEANSVEIHAEIVAAVGSHILDSNLGSACARASTEGPARFEHRIPPGYGDGDKDENKFGDLCLWFELLGKAKDLATEFNTIILLSNDNKKDWRYAPDKRRLHTSKTGLEKNIAPIIRIADPRLVHELRLHSESAIDFRIASVDDLVWATSTGGGNSLQNLAAAQQFFISATDPRHLPVEVRATSEEPGASPAMHLVSDARTRREVIPTVSRPEPVPEPAGHMQPEDAAFSSLGARAFADSLYEPGTPESAIDLIITRLRSHNWYTQNAAVEKIPLLTGREFSVDSWFVLGRNIYQAAVGGAFEAQSFIRNAASRLAKQDSTAANLILAGMFFEVYFDREGQQRTDAKTARLDDLFDIPLDARYRPCIDFLSSRLERIPEVAVLPGTPRIDLELTVQLTSVVINDREVWFLHDALLAGHSLLEVGEAPELSGRVRVEEVIEAVEQRYGVPRSWIRTVVEPAESSTSWFEWPAERRLRRVVNRLNADTN